MKKKETGKTRKVYADDILIWRREEKKKLQNIKSTGAEDILVTPGDDRLQNVLHFYDFRHFMITRDKVNNKYPCTIYTYLCIYVYKYIHININAYCIRNKYMVNLLLKLVHFIEPFTVQSIIYYDKNLFIHKSYSRLSK